MVDASWVSREEYLRALVTSYCYETSLSSVYSHARRVAVAHSRLVELDREVVPVLLDFLARGYGWMHVMHLLGEITGEWPSAPADEPVAAGFVATDVAKARELWLKWGRERGHLLA